MTLVNFSNAQAPLNQVLEVLAPHADVLDGEPWGAMRAAIEALAPALDSVREEGRNLRIAVVGQMKAGKSSFLNAAFFNRNLLPKADTPMTAALTKIAYAPKTRAEVVFYSVDDWAGIEQRAAEYAQCYEREAARLMERDSSPFAKPRQPTRPEVEAGIPQACVASRELVDKAQARGLDVRRYLGQTRQLPEVESPDALALALHEYVGSGGEFTAITKMSALYVNDPRLEGLEIIDTPGFNDPVISRGQQTRDYLKRCDVVFLLSAVSQFLTQADMELVRNQLPEAGIDAKAIFLIGSQCDVALRQDKQIARMADTLSAGKPPEHRAAAKVAAMAQLLERKMVAHAQTTLKSQLDAPGLDDATRRILEALAQATPCFVSGWAWLMAEGFERPRSADDQEQFERLCRDLHFDFDAASLRQLSNMPAVRDNILRQREHKARLLAGKEAALVAGTASKVRDRLADLTQRLNGHGERIRSGNLQDLAAMETQTLQRMTQGRARLENVFDEQVVKALQKFALLKTEIREQALRYSKVRTQQEVTTDSYEVSDSTWYNPFSYGRTRTVHHDVVTVYASTQDTIEDLLNLTIEATRRLQQSVVDCVDLVSLRRSVSQQAMALFDTSSAEFDAEMMLLEVEKSLRRITIPEVDFGRKDYTQTVLAQFGSHRVSESQISALQQAQTAAVASIIADLECEVAAKVAEITSKLESTAKSFVADLTRDIQASLERLRSDIANKERVLEAHAMALAALAQAQALAGDLPAGLSR